MTEQSRRVEACSVFGNSGRPNAIVACGSAGHLYKSLDESTRRHRFTLKCTNRKPGVYIQVKVKSSDSEAQRRD